MTEGERLGREWCQLISRPDFAIGTYRCGVDHERVSTMRTGTKTALACHTWHT